MYDNQTELKLIGLIGSKKFENKRFIQDFIFELKKYNKNNDIEISTSGRRDGAEKYIRKYALDFDFLFREYNPTNTPYTLYSALPKGSYLRIDQKNPELHRDKKLSEHIDILYIFKYKDETLDEFNHVIQCMSTLNKPYEIINV